MNANVFDSLEEIFPDTGVPPATGNQLPTNPEDVTRQRLAALVDEAERLSREAEIRALQADLLTFVRAAWHLVEPKQEFSVNWHIEEMCKVLMLVTAGKLHRVRINVPPGTMKSLLASVFWPAWEWTSNGSLRYLTASYGAQLSTRDNTRMRDIVESAWYRERFDLSLVNDQNAKTRFNTDKSGWRIATSVGGVGTGEHPDRIIIDDPITAQDARSVVERRNANDWFDRTVSPRGAGRKAAIVIIMQRLHEEDLSGHVEAKDPTGWETVCFPMRYEVFRKNDPDWKPDVRDHRTVPGELLWPQIYDEAKVKQLELNLGPYSTAGQLQQRPAPEGGGLFKREWFRIIEAIPVSKSIKWMRGWDTAGTEDGGDWTVGVKIGMLDGVFIVADVVREQLGPAGVNSLIHTTAMLDGKKVAQREEKEGGSAGVAVIANRAKLLKGYDYRGVNISGDKVTRAKPFRAQCEAGNVLLLRGEWNHEYLSELSNFPVGHFDDQVDGSSCSFNGLTTEEEEAGGVLAKKAAW